MEEEKGDPIQDALKKVIRVAMSADGVKKGLNQVGKSLDKHDAFICVLAEDCDDPKYKRLITALAKQNKIPLIMWPERKDLGEWTGQCKYEKNADKKGDDLGKARKIRGCSSLVITDFGQDSNEKLTVEQYIKENNL
jgi:small subunit ribosomal protein S12e